ncbi:protein-tyrosine phosphatase-like protein [Mrakia frigida]|uniref:protein-tyrosine phosphatase-like protein n=1 Tax=Mrakia frigida TaxID=29902 RepID=UPI003FCBEF76
MDVSMDGPSTSTAASSSAPPSHTHYSAPLDEVFYTSYPVVQDVPVGQPIEDWKYEMRREAQLILPNLYLGPFQTSKQFDVLKSFGVTHIVCIRDKQEAFLVKPRFPEHFVYLTLDISDHEDQNLIRIFPQTRNFIDDAIAHGGTVFVHCNGGISLGPSVVVGYVMAKRQTTYEEALKWVQSRRYCISPNQGFMYQLKEYEPIYRATLSAEAAALAASSNPTPSPATNSTRRKRAGDEDSDEDEDPSANGNAMMSDDPEPTNGGAEWSHKPERRMQRVDQR